MAVIMPLVLMAFSTVLYFLNPSIGRLILFMIVSIFSAPLYIFSNRLRINYQQDDYINLNAEGIEFREKGTEGLIPWDSVQEIKSMQRCYVIESRGRNLHVWNDIAPTQHQRNGFLEMMKLDVSDSHIVTLMRQINTMNPAVFYLAPEMSRTFQYILAGIFLALIIGIIIIVLLFAI
jgi:hypothetical protein